MDEMMKAISKYANGTWLKVEWENGQLILEGKIDTIYESNNGLEEEDEGYKEFYACAFNVEKVINNSKDKECQEGALIEISIENEPTLIVLNDGNVIWRKWYLDAIRYGEAMPDPRGSNATMYYTTMYKNGKMYNLEVLYDEIIHIGKGNITFNINGLIGD